MELKGLTRILTCSLLAFFLAGCQPAFMKKLSTNETDEQLYINAELDFSVEYPLAWKRKIIPVSSPDYSANSHCWIIGGSTKERSDSGLMQIESLPKKKSALAEHLKQFLSSQPQWQTEALTPINHSAGEALQVLAQDAATRYQIITIRGQRHDFIIVLSTPKDTFAQFLPVFEQVIDSFSEIQPPSH